jgi:enamine deaminase RidA (YjgF/YER057c/UK114 family)
MSEISEQMTPEDRIIALGLELPEPTVVPDGLHLPFVFVNIRGNRAVISGHPKSAADGSIAGPYGKVGRDLTTEEAALAAREIGLSIFANLRAAIGSLDRVTGWVRVFGMVNSAEGYAEQHSVITGCSDLIIDVFGADVGRHARSAIGVAGLPLDFAIEIEAEVEIAAD